MPYHYILVFVFVFVAGPVAAVIGMGNEVSEVKTEANGSKTKRHKTLVFS